MSALIFSALIGAALATALPATAADFFTARPPADAPYRNAALPVNARVADLLARMTPTEKVNQLLSPWPTKFNCTDILAAFGSTSVGAIYAYSISGCGRGLSGHDALNFLQGTLVNSSRLGIPVATISETLHSSVQGGAAFPNPTLLGQTWDAALVEAIGAVIGLEARTAGISRGFAPVLQVVTDPRFGRYEEAFGEDPFIVATLGAAMVRGQQGTGGPSAYLEDVQHVSCEAKHFVAYGFSGRDFYRAELSQATLMDVYMRPWRAAIAAGLRGLMVAHPEVAGLPNHGNGPLLSGVVRGMLGGAEMFFASDAGDVEHIASHGITASTNESAIYALTAGLDQELVTTCYPSLVDSLARGLVNVSYIDAAVTRILREKVALHLLDGPAYWSINSTLAAATLDAPAHRALSRAAATAGIVLLQNEPSPLTGRPLLPLSGLGSAITRVAVVGPNGGCAGGGDGCPAADAYRGGYCNGGSPTVTLFDAIAAVPGVSATFTVGANITNAGDESGIPAAIAAAAAAQLVVAVVGDTTSGFGKGTCAEGIDADTIDLPGSQLALLSALAAGPTPLVVVGVHGRPFTLGAGPTAPSGANNGLLAQLPALLAAFRPGEDGGAAILDILTGAANPSGRLTANWLRHVGALRGPANPYFQPRGVPTNAYVTEPATALFPFGFGLSYNNATIASAALSGLPANRTLTPTSTFAVEGTLDNAGPAGAAVLQLYYSQDAPTKYVRYASRLVAFAKVALPANATAVPFSITVRVADTDAWDVEAQQYVVYAGNYTFALGLHSQALTYQFPQIPVDGYQWRRPQFPGAPTT